MSLRARCISQPRAVGALAAQTIVDEGRSLDRVLPNMLDAGKLNRSDSAWVQELVYGITRQYWHLEDIARNLLDKPLRARDRDIHFLLLAGLYQIVFMRTPEHAALSETVAGCEALGKDWAKRLINGCLRNFLRNPVSVNESSHYYSHPAWLGKAISDTWPEYADTILSANNLPAPMCLRVNVARSTRSQYLERLAKARIPARPDELSEVGLVLDRGMPVDRLPGFAGGMCSVQDTAAQFAASLLDAAPTDRILDACAAPGGKTGHILEYTRGLAEVVALDISPKRLRLVKDTLARLGMAATCIEADAAMPREWWDGEPFDRVLLDAPCSGTGVIRRHPDIRHHRRPQDVDTLGQKQSALLDAVWQTLRPGGRLLYATCSILPQENEHQVRAFLERTNNAREIDAVLPTALNRQPGIQTLQGVHQCDGFYYGILEKQ